jgi:iron(III) transport system ATP-binding protein
LLQLDTPSEIYNQPADLFVAGFTGATNVIEGMVVSRDGGFGAVQVASGDRLIARMGADLPVGASARVALRPDNVGLTTSGDGFVGRVETRHYQGTQTVYQVSVLGTSIEAMEVGSAARYPEGSPVTVSVPPEVCWAYPTP